jgi:hypothetical protein
MIGGSSAPLPVINVSPQRRVPTPSLRSTYML